MPEAAETLYSFSAERLDGSRIRLEEFRGQVLLVVNTASQCGFTPQYKGLEALHREYGNRGFSVLAFPCNQFGRQEPGSGVEIAEFCDRNFGVSFPIFAKIEVNGPGTHPLYRYLKSRQKGRFGLLTGGRIHWNFTKFLCDRQGEVVARFGSATAPEKLAASIQNLLDR
jgi:glutathione peroxidase